MAALASTPVSDILPDDFKLVSLKDSDSALDALLLLVEHNYYGAPVLSSGNEYVGMLELEDLLRFLVSLFADRAGGDIGEAIFEKDQLDAIHASFCSKSLSELARKADTLPLTTTVQSTIDKFVNDRVSRLPLTDSDGAVAAIISQAQILKFLNANLDKLDGVSQTLEEANIGSTTMVVGHDTQNAITSFATMIGIGISHLALVSEDGMLLGNLSVKDIKGIVDGGFPNLTKPVIEYVNIIRRMTIDEKAPVIHVDKSETVGRTIQRLVATKLHRIYLTSSTGGKSPRGVRYTPTGVVSIRDILSLFKGK